MYLCLNILYAPAGSQNTIGQTHGLDYRNTPLYQDVLRTVTSSFYVSDLSTFPHRCFFGLSEPIIPTPPIVYEPTCGRPSRVSGYFPWREFLALNQGEPHRTYITRAADQYAAGALMNKNLPRELVNKVMAHCPVAPRTRLEIPEDPLHQESQHLDYCWTVIVRCNKFAEMVGVNIDWADVVMHRLDGFRLYRNANLGPVLN